jgi:hypothetical protein
MGMHIKEITMKKIPLVMMTLLFIFNVAPVLADSNHWEPRGADRARVQIHEDHHRGFRGGYGHRGHGWGWAPWVGAAAIGTTLYFANTYTPPPATIIVSPPVVVDPSRVAYFCQTAQQYYPTVPTCNVPWQVVNY